MASTSSEPKPIAQIVNELWELLKAYAKQETIDPLTHLKHFMLWGLAGSLLLAIGVPMLALAGLRALQTETVPHLTGSLTWIPYLIVVFGLAIVTALVMLQITKDRGGAKQSAADASASKERTS